jgi:arylsulfatase A-like enzyme
MPAPNVLWICTDQQRFDTLGCYGNDLVDTENVDELAAEGVRFDRAFCQSPVCTPSRASFLTGRYPRTTRTRQNGQAIPDDEVLVTRQLADAGYTCGLSGKLHIAPGNPEHADRVPMTERRIDDGYADFHWSQDPINRDLWPTNEYHQWLRERGVEYETRPYRDSEYVQTSMPAEHHATTWCAEKAITFVEENERFDDPWLFSVNIFDPHTPFDPPEAYLERYVDRLAEIPLPDYTDGERETKPIYHSVPPGSSERARFPFDEMSDRDHRMMRAAYWAMIDLIDDQVGRMLDALERTGQREDTIVIFMSDHGEMLGDHGIYLKGPYFYEPAVRVPLVVSAPELVEPGRVSDALVELTDVSPTLLDAAGVEHHPGMQGASLWPMLTGEAPLDSHRESVYSEYYHALERPGFYDRFQEETGPERGTESFHRPFERTDVMPAFHDKLDDVEGVTLPYATMVRTDRYKLVRVHGLDTGELYDLEADPSETENRYDDPDYADVRARMFERLADRMAGTIDPLPQRHARF